MVAVCLARTTPRPRAATKLIGMASLFSGRRPASLIPGRRPASLFPGRRLCFAFPGAAAAGTSGCGSAGYRFADLPRSTGAGAGQGPLVAPDPRGACPGERPSALGAQRPWAPRKNVVASVDGPGRPQPGAAFIRRAVRQALYDCWYCRAGAELLRAPRRGGGESAAMAPVAPRRVRAPSCVGRFDRTVATWAWKKQGTSKILFKSRSSVRRADRHRR